MIHLRPATDADAEFFWHLRQEITPALMWGDHQAWWREEDERRYVAEVAGRPIGVIRIGAWRILSLQVLAAEQGKGYGTAMLTAIKPLARESGLKDLRATVAPDNAASQRAFLRAGYMPTRFVVDL